MNEFLIAIAITAPLLFSVFVVSVLVQVIRDQKAQISKLTAAALSSPSSVTSAVYMSAPTESEKPEAHILEERAEQVRDGHPLGL